MRTSRSGLLAVLVTVSVLTAAACGSSSKATTPAASTSTTPGPAATSSAPAAGGYQAAVAATAAAEKGTNRPVDPTPRPAVKGKSIVVISAGQATSSSQVPSDGAVEAAKAIGWKVTLYDAKLNPSNYSPLIRQAIAAHADGIVLDSIDCQAATAALKEAKAAHIALVPITAFDCTDPAAGGQPTGVYSAVTNFGPAGKNVDAFTESYGADQANYIIAQSHNKAKIIVLQDPEFTVLHYTFQGFSKAVHDSGGSQIVDTVTFTVADLIDGQLVNKMQAALLQHPDATWIKSPYTTATQLGHRPRPRSQQPARRRDGRRGISGRTGPDPRRQGDRRQHHQRDVARLVRDRHHEQLFPRQTTGGQRHRLDHRRPDAQSAGIRLV